MMDVAIFAAKAFVIVFAIAAIIILIAVIAARAGQKAEIEVEPLHQKFKNWGDFLQSFTQTKDERKQAKKQRKKEKKEEQKQSSEKPRVFVLNFEGDMKASQVEAFREEITTVLQVATPKDEVIVKVESPGGVVHGYGLAASQLMRIRAKSIPLTVCVDKVAASGGYLMACTANRILGAPFAIVGSIGVVAQVPNVHRLLKKHDVDYKEYTAGDFKRTVSLLGEITPKGEQKFQEQLESVHELFKKFVSQHRPQLDINQVATGEYWYGEQAKALGLIDEIKTSDDYLLEKYSQDAQIYEVQIKKQLPWWNKLSEAMGGSLFNLVERSLSRSEKDKFL